MIRIFIADDHNSFREKLFAILEEENDFLVVGQAENGEELIRKYERTKPDLIISDISMPIKSGPDAIKEIRKSDKNIKVLFLSGYSGDDYIYSVINSGAHRFINKGADINELRLAIKEVAEGRHYFCGKSASDLDAIKKRFEINLEKEYSIGNNAKLTIIEEDILILISEYMSTDEIANKLKISPRTVESHRLNIIKKFKLKSIYELMKFSVEYSNRIQSEKEILHN